MSSFVTVVLHIIIYYDDPINRFPISLKVLTTMHSARMMLLLYGLTADLSTERNHALRDARDFVIVNSHLHDDFDAFKREVKSEYSYLQMNEMLMYSINHDDGHGII